MNKSVFFIGLVALLPLFAYAVQTHRTQPDYVILSQQAVALEGIWFVLAYLGWLGTRWQRGHWDANALSASSDRRRFLLLGILIGALLSIWGGYLGIIERVFW
ncbi:MAG: hypothetical protein R3351_02275 [Nitrospirales bacterium]|nr:hypothetical protein [Nitrospirales bacterium]